MLRDTMFPSKLAGVAAASVGRAASVLKAECAGLTARPQHLAAPSAYAKQGSSQNAAAMAKDSEPGKGGSTDDPSALHRRLREDGPQALDDYEIVQLVESGKARSIGEH